MDEVQLREAEQWLESADALVLGYHEALPKLVEASRAAIKSASAKQKKTRKQLRRLSLTTLITALVALALAVIVLWQYAAAERRGKASAESDLGDERYNARDTKGAEASYELALQTDPDYSRPHTGLAMVFAYLGQFARAQLEASTAVRLDGTSAFAHLMLGRADDRLGRYNDAVTEYKRVLEMDDPVVRAHAHYSLGLIYIHHQLYEDAFAQLKEAAELVPDNKAFEENLGWAYLVNNEVELTQRQFDKVIHDFPSEPYAYIGRGLVQAKLLQTDDALKSWREGFLLLSESKDSHDRMTFAFYSLVVGDSKAIPMDIAMRQLQPSPEDIRDVLIDAEIIAGSANRSPQVEQAVKALALALASLPSK